MKLVSRIKAIVFFACLIIFMSACCNSAQQESEGQKGAGIFERSSDIGGVKLIGSMIYDASMQTYTLSGGGMNVWGSFDQHFFAWNKVKGNFSLTTKVAFEGKGVNAHRKVGIMVRDALTGNSRCVHIDYHGDGRTSLQYRSEEGEETGEIVAPENGNFITLERVGNKFIMRSATGVKPTEITAEVEMDLPATVYVGLFICSHEADVLETGYFTDVEFKKL